MRRIFQWLLRKPLTWLANHFSSSPNQKAVFASLSKLLKDIHTDKDNAGPIVPFIWNEGKFVIVSDQHKGIRDGADDFRNAEKNYLAALDFYYQKGFTLINNGDAEELWENTPAKVMENNQAALSAELQFLQQDRYYRIYGNHDLEWKYDIQRNSFLTPFFGDKLKIVEGVILQTQFEDQQYEILISHGHQGDQKSDGNPLSTWVVAALWTPVQRFLDISINTTSDSFELIDKHNIMMYEWSASQKNLIFISGHTHKPVFASLDHVDQIQKQIEKAQRENNIAAIPALAQALRERKVEYSGKGLIRTKAQPSYFNSGCCCFSDGDMTTIEIDSGRIRLVKWQYENQQPVRKVLEESELGYVVGSLTDSIIQDVP